MSNPMNGLVSNSTLLEAKELVNQYREGKEPPGTTDQQVGLVFTLLQILLLHRCINIYNCSPYHMHIQHTHTTYTHNILHRILDAIHGLLDV